MTTNSPSKGGLFVYCQSIFGVGHLVRMLRLLDAVREACPDLPATLIYGGVNAEWIQPWPSLTVIRLKPSIILVERGSIACETNIPVPVALRLRRDLLIQHFALMQPDIVLFEHFPFGRLLFRDEVVPLLHAAAARSQIQIWCTVRDIPMLHPRFAAEVDSYLGMFARVFVHSDPDVCPLDLDGIRLPNLAGKVTYTGYVTPRERRSNERLPHVVVHAGGGRDGECVWRSADCLEGIHPTMQFLRVGERNFVNPAIAENLVRCASGCICMAGYIKPVIS